LRRLALAAAGVYLLFLLLIVAHLTDRLILYPTTSPLDTTHLRRTGASLIAGGTVEIFIARPPDAAPGEPEAYVLSFIGNAARAEPTAAFFAKDWAGYPVEVWSVNYPGYGTSPGKARLSNIAPSALAAYDELRRQCGNKPIILEARSIGTVAALYVAAHRPVAGLILHNPPPLRPLLLQRYGWWNLWLVGGPLALSVPKDLDSIANARAVNVPAVFVIADADSVVPAKYQQLIVDAYAGPKQVIHVPDASHTARAIGAAQDQLRSAMNRLFQRASAPQAPHSPHPGPRVVRRK
jgi:uncharacterized protein